MFRIRPVTVLMVSLLALSACSRGKSPEHLSFETPEAAVEALVAAAEKHDVEALRRILGPGADSLLITGDDVADRNERAAFVERYRAGHQLVAGGPDDLVLQVGNDPWPVPVPLVRVDERWKFDGEAGTDEIVLRRIGANELRTIDVMRGFVVAQKEYASTGHDGQPAGVYAQRLRSDPGKQNGLYWEVAAGERMSPAGPLLAAATADGYGKNDGVLAPYHGYVYRPLLAQGPAANGGEGQYVVDGKLTKGFALLATPNEYGVTGVMSFIVNQDGVVWQRDLGEQTEQVAAEIDRFDPGEGWTPVAAEAPIASND